MLLSHLLDIFTAGSFSAFLQVSVIDLVRRILSAMQSRLAPDIRNEVVHEIKHQYLSAAKARARLGWAPAGICVTRPACTRRPPCRS